MPDIAERLRTIKNFDELIRYLEEELDWPCEKYGFDEITFQYLPAELGIKEEEAAQIKCIHQLRPFFQGQPWGIFFIEFEKKRIPIVLLRRVLSHLVIKKRASANKAETAAWDIDNLLFISAYGEEDTDQREIAFAHFHQENGDLPTLRVLGWDGADTVLKMEYVAKTLKEKLRWPQNPKDVETWREQWSGAFLHKPGHTIRTANELAERLAELARSIRDAAQTLMAHETEKGHLRSLHKAFQTALIHDLSEEDFADTYAQTITYGLLTAAISRTEMTAGKYGTALVAGNVTDMVPITNPFLREMLETFLHAGGRRGGIDFDELGIQDVVELLRGEETDLPAVLRDFGNRTPGEDPVIHFYEHFLNAYNKKLKIQRGVFYTPKPVVSYIVRSVHEVLQKEFGLEDGLADTATWGEMEKRIEGLTRPATAEPDSPFVTVLDPATGTATFLVEVIDIVFKTMTAKWDKQGLNKTTQQTAWNEYVPKHLLPRLYGYELMMAPYAIAHMKIGLKLHETGYHFGSAERVRVYLTNSLEEPSPLAEQRAASLFEALGHEAQAVNDVKRNINFTVVIGNPPYSGISANMTENLKEIIEPYKYINGIHFKEKKHWLHDDYVKFIRLSQTIIDNTHCGIVGMITNHAFYDNPTFRGMRWNLIQSFSQIYLLDLHGNAMKHEVNPSGVGDKNVFDIQQGVAISIFVNYPNGEQVCDQGDLWGSRKEKYKALNLGTFENLCNKRINPKMEFFFFIPRTDNGPDEYWEWMPLNKIFLVFSGGFITARDHFVIDFDDGNLISRIAIFASSYYSDEKIRSDYFVGLGANQYPDGDTRGWKLPEARKKVRNDKDWKQRIRNCLYRPFDIRWVYWTDWMVDWPRPEVSSHLLGEKDNIALIFMRQVASGDVYSHFLVTRLPADNRAFYSNKGIMTVAPLYLHDGAVRRPGELDLFSQGVQANLKVDFVKILHNLFPHEENSPKDTFHYMYAVFHSPTYRSRYAEFLKIDFPRLPLTSNLELFRQLCGLGKDLVALHLLEAPALNKAITKFKGKGDNVVAKGHPKYQDGVVLVNPSQGFEDVPEDVWEFHIGGYQVCHKWLKDRRGRQLSADDIVHYQKVVVALKETIRLMGEVDKAIESAGGWPMK